MAATYLDLDLSFKTHPSTGDFLKKTDLDAAKFCLRNLMLTHPGEQTDNPLFGIGIKELLFELMNPILNAFVKRKIITEVANWLPEISLQDVLVDANPDSGELVVIMTYYVVGNPQIQRANLVLDRAR